MIEQETKQTKVEQIIMQRRLKFVLANIYCDVENNQMNKLYCESSWRDIINQNKIYDLENLILSGFKVVSVNQSWAASKDFVSFGFETMILERETKT